MVALERLQVVARRDPLAAAHRLRPQVERVRVRVEAFGARDDRGRPAQRRRALGRRPHDVDVLAEVVDAQRAGEPGRATGRAGRGWRPRRSRRARSGRTARGRPRRRCAPAASSASGSSVTSSRCSGREPVHDLHRLGRVAHEHDPTAVGERHLRSRRGAARPRRSPRARRSTASATDSIQVTTTAVPPGPCSACAARSAATSVGWRVLVRHDDQLGGSGRRLDARPRPRRRPRAWRCSRTRCPARR